MKRLTIKLFICLCVLFVFDEIYQARRTMFWAAPAGSGINCSAGDPCSIAEAISQVAPGDTILMQDGAYTAGVVIDCDVNALNGTATDRITLVAINERVPVIQADGGNTNWFRMANCDYWNVYGLQITTEDNAAGWYGASLVNVSFLDFSRNVVHKNNEHDNCSSFQLACVLLFGDGVTDSLFEYNEFIDFSAHAVQFVNLNVGGMHRNAFRFNYCNPYPRMNINITTGFGGGCIGVRDAADDNNILNNAFETTFADPDYLTEGAHGGGFCCTRNNNKYLGNIFRGTQFIFKRAWESPDGGMLADVLSTNTLVEHNLFIRGGHDAFFVGDSPMFWFRNAKTSIGRNNTFIADVTQDDCIRLDRENDVTTGEESAEFYNNALLLCNVGINNVFGDHTVTADRNGVFGNSTNYVNVSATNDVTVDPELDACVVKIPEGSPYKGAGVGGADIGATIQFRYNINGTLSDIPLWDESTGAFPHAAVITGVNDQAGHRAFDLHTRLNISECDFSAVPPALGIRPFTTTIF